MTHEEIREAVRTARVELAHNEVNDCYTFVFCDDPWTDITVFTCKGDDPDDWDWIGGGDSRAN